MVKGESIIPLIACSLREEEGGQIRGTFRLNFAQFQGSSFSLRKVSTLDQNLVESTLILGSYLASILDIVERIAVQVQISLTLNNAD